jgi:hypothetical protein
MAASAGSFHTVFLKADRTLWAMGSNGSGQLGTGNTTSRNTPQQIATAVVAEAAGDFHTMFVKADGTLWGMGQNLYGGVGDGGLQNRSVPTQTLTSGVVAVDAGTDYSLWLRTDGAMWGAGRNDQGQLGNGATSFFLPTPAQSATGVFRVSAATSHSRFFKTDGSFWVTGSNAFGQFGDGTTDSTITPKQMFAGPVPAPAAPGGLTATDGVLTDAVRLTWNAVIGATHYEIWRNTTNSPETATKLGAWDYPLYYDTTVTAGVLYYYWVKAVAFSAASAMSAGDAGLAGSIAPVFTSAPAATFHLSIAQSFTVTAIGNPAPVLSLVSGTLPAGLSFLPATGTIIGRPSGPAGVSTLTFQASNGVGAPVTQAFTLNVSALPLIVGTASTARTVAAGQSETLSVSVFSALPSTFQWKRNGRLVATPAGIKWSPPTRRVRSRAE